MRAKDRIRKALSEFYEPGDLNSAAVYKGNDYDGVRQSYGWFLRPFGRTPIYLGGNVNEVLEEINGWEKEEKYV